jgi:hypothetical protein
VDHSLQTQALQTRGTRNAVAKLEEENGYIGEENFTRNRPFI